MKIGIDLSSLQSAHRMRGIGYTLINLLNSLPAEAKQNHSFVFYIYPIEGSGYQDPFELLDLAGVDYEIRELLSPHSSTEAAGRMRHFIRLRKTFEGLSDFYFGDSRISDTSELDVFLQTDQSQPLPKRRGLKTALVLYDIIPYVLEWDYLWSYSTARMKGFSRRAALRVQMRRKVQARKLKISMRRADLLLAISEATKNDFVSKLRGRSRKIHVSLLGITMPDGIPDKASSFSRYKNTSWKYIKRPVNPKDFGTYLLFVGGADHRRKLQDLVVAFNQLRARGHDIKLVLAGDSMQGPKNISTIKAQRALLNSSYLDDIYFLGFIGDEQRDWLYSNALAFVFPSKYEGFGLPVLEAMSYGCPVITYDNAATREVAGDLPIYADDYQGIFDAVVKLNGYSDTKQESLKKSLVKHANQYQWSDTSQNVISELEGLK